MSRSTSVNSVLAPSSVSLYLSLRLRAQGRSDAKRYKGLQDFTRTHALIVAQNKACSGQREVNQWVIQAIEPLQSGNARTIVQLEALEEELRKLQKDGAVSGRKQRTLSARSQYLENQIINFESQYQANIAKAKSILLQGEQAIGSWDNYYEQMAGIYTRARASKLKTDVASVQAEVPELESVELVEIQGFDEVKTEQPSRSKK